MQRRTAYSSVTVAPRSVNVFLSFSASSFDIPSLRTFGSDSTNFFAWRYAPPANTDTDETVQARGSGAQGIDRYEERR